MIHVCTYAHHLQYTGHQPVWFPILLVVSQRWKINAFCVSTVGKIALFGEDNVSHQMVSIQSCPMLVHRMFLRANGFSV